MSEQPTEEQVIAMLKRIMGAGEILVQATAVKLGEPIHSMSAQKVPETAAKAIASPRTKKNPSTRSPNPD